MGLGENLQFLRKKNDITQEQLAEKLEVSRQSVSKWESDTTYPEMEKLIQLCQMFHLSMDDLIQKDVSSLYVEDKSHYDQHMNLFSKMISSGVGLILLGVSLMLLLQGIGFSEELSSILFFVLLVIAVAIFIVMGIRHDAFQQKNPYIENFYAEEEIDGFNKKFSIMIVSGVSLILIGIIFMIGAESLMTGLFADAAFDADSLAASLLLFFITAAVTILVYAGIQKEKYNLKQYNLLHDKESEEYKKDKLKGTVCGCLMMTATIIYLISAFINDSWGMPYVVVFPVFGIGCGIASTIIEAKYKK
ncbi:MAG: helix-turn-helix domain-containing protein [Blautia sp.]|nr:helix-turn-helix domain-containing protein [Blautia sp.]MCM1199855.1 helix-turn-helix domain-containing protein [Bacteroides fragilis]